MASRPAKPTSRRLAILLVLPLACTKATFEPTDAKADANEPPEAAPSSDADSACPAAGLEGCLPSGSQPCDPVCQTGECDWCMQKCTYAYETGSVVPVPACAARGSRTTLEACTVSSAGSPSQADDCLPGSICLAPAVDVSSTYCFSLCHTKVDCPGDVACAQRALSPAGGEVTVCDPPYDQCGIGGACCDPLANTGCDPGRYCLLVGPDRGSGHSRTVCEFSYGVGRDGSSCGSSRDCQTRYTCVEGTCFPICTDANPCPPGSTCTALGSEYGCCT